MLKWSLLLAILTVSCHKNNNQPTDDSPRIPDWEKPHPDPIPYDNEGRVAENFPDSNCAIYRKSLQTDDVPFVAHCPGEVVPVSIFIDFGEQGNGAKCTAYQFWETQADPVPIHHTFLMCK